MEKQKMVFESGNELAAYAAKQINYHVMGYYPITPSTQIAENLDLKFRHVAEYLRIVLWRYVIKGHRYQEGIARYRRAGFGVPLHGFFPTVSGVNKLILPLNIVSQLHLFSCIHFLIVQY